MKIPHFIYKKYPRLRVVLSKRCRIYNEQLDLVEQLEDKGRIVVIRPEKPMEVDRIETDIKKLTDLYEGRVCLAKKKCSKKNEYFKNKLLAKKNVFYTWGYWRNGGSFLLYGVDEVLPHITRMNALSFWKER